MEIKGCNGLQGATAMPPHTAAGQTASCARRQAIVPAMQTTPCFTKCTGLQPSGFIVCRKLTLLIPPPLAGGGQAR